MIGGLSWVHLIGWCNSPTSDYGQLSYFNPTQLWVKNKAVDAPIKFEKIAMVMIKSKMWLHCKLKVPFVHNWEVSLECKWYNHCRCSHVVLESLQVFLLSQSYLHLTERTWERSALEKAKKIVLRQIDNVSSSCKYFHGMKHLRLLLLPCLASAKLCMPLIPLH